MPRLMEARRKKGEEDEENKKTIHHEKEEEEKKKRKMHVSSFITKLHCNITHYKLID